MIASCRMGSASRHSVNRCHVLCPTAGSGRATLAVSNYRLYARAARTSVVSEYIPH